MVCILAEIAGSIQTPLESKTGDTELIVTPLPLLRGARAPGYLATYSIESDGSRRDVLLKVAGRSRFAPVDGLRTLN